MYDIIFNVTKKCNYKCSYCNVIKNKDKIIKNDFNINLIDDFILKNKNDISLIRFFWWEPLLNFELIKSIIDKTYKYIWKNYDIVTNTSLLNDENCYYFSNYFKQLFFSVDVENNFDNDKVNYYIKKYNLENIVYFNIIIDPDNLEKSFKLFFDKYNFWYRKFNILPVYYTKNWSDDSLLKFSKFMKNIMDLKIKDKKLDLFWFQDNLWNHTSLIYKAFFVDTDFNIYYSDLVTMEKWEKYKDKLLLGNIKNSINFLEIDNNFYKNIIEKFEYEIILKYPYQNKLNKLMDYFSVYLNKVLVK